MVVRAPKRWMRKVIGWSLSFLAALGIGWLVVLGVEYDPYTAITSVSITSPSEGTIWCAGAQHTVGCSTANDTDCNKDTGQLEDDSVTHYWTCTGGSFANNDNIGTSVDYVCPATGGTKTLTVYADDNYAADNNAALADETATSASVNVIVFDSVEIAALDMFSINKTGISVSATVTGGGSPISGVTVGFSSSDLTFPSGSTAVTNGSGVATVTASTGGSPSSSQDSSSVTATTQCDYPDVTDSEAFTVVEVSTVSPTSAHIVVGGYTDNSLYAVDVTFTVAPAMAGVPLTFQFEGDSWRGIDRDAQLEVQSSTTNANGQAVVRVRSSDWEKTATVRGCFEGSYCSADVTFDGITACPPSQ